MTAVALANLEACTRTECTIANYVCMEPRIVSDVGCLFRISRGQNEGEKKETLKGRVGRAAPCALPRRPAHV